MELAAARDFFDHRAADRAVMLSWTSRSVPLFSKYSSIMN
jgi:hypothetical protein